MAGTLSAVLARVPQIVTNFKQGHTGQVGMWNECKCSYRSLPGCSLFVDPQHVSLQRFRKLMIQSLPPLM